MGRAGGFGHTVGCVQADSILHMSDPTTVPLNLRVSQSVKDRVVKQKDRYDSTIASISKVALVLGLEALERLEAQTPDVIPLLSTQLDPDPPTD